MKKNHLQTLKNQSLLKTTSNTFSYCTQKALTSPTYKHRLYVMRNFLEKKISSKGHLGHKSLKLKKAWHPTMSFFLLGTRNKSSILSVDDTLNFLMRALYVLTLVLKSGGNILIVNNNPEFSDLLKQAQKKITLPQILYNNEKWVGGLLTNWKHIFPSVIKFIMFSQQLDEFITEKRVHLPRYKKWKSYFQGFINCKKTENIDEHAYFKQLRHINEVYRLSFNFMKKPALIFVLNPNDNMSVIQEAFRLHIPVIAITDSNTDLSFITYPIPSNNQSIFFVWYCLNWILKVARKKNSIVF